MGDGQQGAYATKASDTDFRRKWDKEEYAERAKQKDDEERERMQENEERMKQEASQREEKGFTKAHGTYETS
jgi:U4/U6.U5 tri-snRNP component SNU23